MRRSLRWFVIQLSCAEEAFDPDALPNLDIFSEYRLYSVAGMEQGKPIHACVCGFSEEPHAKAVAGYSERSTIARRQTRQCRRADAL